MDTKPQFWNTTAIVSDQKFWNEQEFIVDLIAGAQQGKVIIDLKQEGPCLESIGINRILDSIVSKLKVNPDQFIINTSNQLNSGPYRQQRLGFVELDLAKSLLQIGQPVHEDFKYRFGIMIGRSNANRLGLASYLWHRHGTNSTITFHFDPHHDFHQANLGLEKFLNYNWSDRHHVFEFLDAVPLLRDDALSTYPCVDQTMYGNIMQAFGAGSFYQDAFCEIVCETFFTGRTFFLTEKTLRSIINRRPFVIQGPKWFLHNLRLLGFKTFDRWWDETYDTVDSDCRYGEIKSVIDYLADKSLEDLRLMYKEMIPVLDHNQRVLAELTNEKILATTFFYE